LASCGWLAISFAACASAFAADAEPVTLAEPAESGRVFEVRSELSVEGKIEVALGGGRSETHPLDVEADLRYLERRLSGTGRDARTLRSLRQYTRAGSKIVVDKETSFYRLRPELARVVAQGLPGGIERHSPAGPLTRIELDLLRMPGDSLAMVGLLPASPVRPGEEWTPASWVAPMLADLEAVVKNELTCKLDSVVGDIATVSFEGKLEGASDGAETSIALAGSFGFDVRNNHIRSLALRQTEKRSVGAVSPGLEVIATVELTRAPAEAAGPLAEEAARAIPLDPPPESLLLTFQTPGEAAFLHDRGWHLFKQTGKVAILRLIEQGSFVAQCNVASIAAAAPGDHTSLEQFQQDIRTSLGERFATISESRRLPTDDGRHLLRVTALGAAGETPMTWIYYLCADPSGRQVSFVFSVESELREKLGGRPDEIVRSVRFTPR
ncbi:MAG: hypothetical protein WD066_12315, partial [Planctomycetaceae bacterium]